MSVWPKYGPLHRQPPWNTPVNGVGGAGDVGFAAESVALFNAMTTPATEARKLVIDTLIRTLKTAGVWTSLDLLYVTAAESNQAGKLNWKAPGTFTAADGGTAPTFVANRGFTGNGTDGRLDTGWDPTANGVNYTQNNASIWVWCATNVQEDRADVGNVTGPLTTIRARTAADLIAVVVNDATLSTGGAITDSRGFSGASRAAAGTKKAWKDGVQSGSDIAVASTGLPTQDQWLCGANATGFSTKQVAAAAWGNALAGKEAAFYNAMLVYMRAVGAA